MKRPEGSRGAQAASGKHRVAENHPLMHYEVRVETIGSGPSGKFDLRRKSWSALGNTHHRTAERAAARHDRVFECHKVCRMGGRNCNCRLVLVVE